MSKRFRWDEYKEGNSYNQIQSKKNGYSSTLIDEVGAKIEIEGPRTTQKHETTISQL